MPPALADFFFIAGLKGHEPAIVRTGPQSTPFRAENVNETSTLEETTQNMNEQGQSKITVPSAFNPRSTPSAINTAPPTPPTTSSGDLPPTIPELPNLLDDSIDNPTTLGMFDDVLAKFSSERDEFVLTLAPLNSPPPNRTSFPLRAVALPEDEEDRLADLNGGRASPLRSRMSLRTKIADLSRRASRTGTLRRQNTNGT
jgi:hypothetical protein